MNKDTKVFVIINSYRIGDILLTSSLTQNIKRIYPNSKVIHLTSPSLIDVAKYQEGVDDVIIWDRKGADEGFLNTVKFAFNFPYKNVFASFPIYGMDRPVVLSHLLGAKYIPCQKQKFFSKFKKIAYKLNFTNKSCQENNLELLTGITKEELKNVPIKFNVPEIKSQIINNLPEKYTVLCLTSSRNSKDIPIDVACEIIEKLKDEKLVLLGKSETLDKYSTIFKEKNYSNLIDLSSKTSILESVAIVKNATSMITVDTGLMHFACAVKTPFVSVFYEKDTELYIPNENLYDCINILSNQTSENIISNYHKLNEDKKCKI